MRYSAASVKELFRCFAAWCGFFRCPMCMKNGGNGRNEFCPECREKLVIFPVEGRCPGCGGPNDTVLAVCSSCLEFPLRPYVDAVALMEYSGAGRTLIRSMKFRKQPELARPLALLAVEKLNESGMVFDAVVPVPLHWRRRLVRSYNQSELVAGLIAAETGKPLIWGLKKIRETPHQAQLKRGERLKNLKGTFAVDDPSFAGKQILLVDDVLTTGATAAAATQVLMANGAKAVRLLCCARTPVKARSAPPAAGRGKKTT
ncbi:MAG: ComF family protein [Lentisphaeria bacterium]|nr:ComF family protein [Lentisphaeria bacterium]